MSRIYVACLAAYNNGILHGRWIEASTNVFEMQDEIKAMLAASPIPDAEEWAIHDTEDLPSIIGEFSGLEPVAEFAALVEDYDWIDVRDLIDIVEEARSIEQAREQLENDFVGIFDEFEDYAYEIADEQLACHGQADSLAARYFDYEAFARDLRMDMHVVNLGSGKVAIFHA